MVFPIPQYWDVAIDGIQIILCTLILVFLIRGRRKKRHSAPGAAFRETGQNFNLQIYTQTLKQEVDQAFANITDAIATEQRSLDSVLANGGRVKEPLGIHQYQSQLHQPAANEISTLASSETSKSSIASRLPTITREILSMMCLHTGKSDMISP